MKRCSGMPGWGLRLLLLSIGFCVLLTGVACPPRPMDMGGRCLAAHFGYRPLRRGMEGEDVWNLQLLLGRLGLFSGDPTGYFGARTEASVKRLQSWRGIKPDGIVADETLDAVEAMLAAWEWSQSGYEVKDGDTLESISRAWGIPRAVLANLNGIPEDIVLKPGDRVKIPVPEFIMHEVKKGECLARIARKYGLDWKQVAALNGIRPPYVIHPGDMLVMPATPESE